MTSCWQPQIIDVWSGTYCHTILRNVLILLCIRYSNQYFTLDRGGCVRDVLTTVLGYILSKVQRIQLAMQQGMLANIWADHQIRLSYLNTTNKKAYSTNTLRQSHAKRFFRLFVPFAYHIVRKRFLPFAWYLQNMPRQNTQCSGT